jgi:two-component system sensor histidine kinase YesM
MTEPGMDITKIKSGMTRARIILLAMALLLAAQGTLMSIGISYIGSINDSVHTQQADVILKQSAQTVTQRLSDVNNLLLLLQMQDFSLFIRNFLILREPSIAASEEKRLLDRLEALRLSPDVVDCIYMIGENVNQISIRKTTQVRALEVLPYLKKDILNEVGLEELLMRKHDQFVRYGMQDFNQVYLAGGDDLQAGERSDIAAFLSRLDGRLLIATGSDKMLTVIVLNDRLFEQAFPGELSGRMALSVVRGENTLLWSSSQQQGLRDSVAAGDRKTPAPEGTYTNVGRDVQPFGVRIVLSSLQPQNVLSQSGLMAGMLAVSLGTLLAAFLFSFFYLRTVFRPFKAISRKIGSKHEPAGAAPVFRRIPEKFFGSRFHSISLRNKLAILFCVALSMMISTNGLLLSELLSGEIDELTSKSATAMGRCAAIGLADQAGSYENLANQIAISQQLQDYLINNRINEYYGVDPLKMFPDLNRISYIVLFDRSGSCIYSSVYSNNSKVFDIASMQLKDVDEPYWIYNYNDILGQTSMALFRKINVESVDKSVWLLIVPRKETFLQVAETGQVGARYSLQSAAGAPVSSNDTAAAQPGAAEGSYAQKLSGGSGWTFSVRYAFPEIAAMKQAFRERFLLSLFIVFLLSVGLALSISTRLTKPIVRLTEAMQLAESDGVAKPLLYDREDEIGGIIHSYNRMILRLEDATRENMRIMEENVKNKIRENELLAMKTRAEMNMLQAQINPHFLYNTLATVNMQSTRRGDAETGRIVAALAGLLRYSISVNADTAPLEQEINHAANYVTIQQARFSNSFLAMFDVPDDVKGLPVLRFILQPLIENSIKHGFEGWESGGEITVRARRSGGELTIRVGDNGVGMDGDTLARLRADMESELSQWQAGGYGIGLKNVYYRLKLQYRDRMKMRIESELMKGTTITMEFPAAPDNDGEQRKMI